MKNEKGTGLAGAPRGRAGVHAWPERGSPPGLELECNPGARCLTTWFKWSDAVSGIQGRLLGLHHATWFIATLTRAVFGWELECNPGWNGNAILAWNWNAILAGTGMQSRLERECNPGLNGFAIQA